MQLRSPRPVRHSSQRGPPRLRRRGDRRVRDRGPHARRADGEPLARRARAPRRARRDRHIPDDTGPALAPNTTGSDHKTRTHAKAKAKADPQPILVGGNVVILSGTGPEPASSAPTPDPAPVPTTRPAQSPAKAKTPNKAPKVVTDESNPVAPAVYDAGRSERRRVHRSRAPERPVRRDRAQRGRRPGAAGQARHPGRAAERRAPGHGHAAPSPADPVGAQSNNSAFALKTSVDMVPAPRATSADPALQMRVRMAIAAAPRGTTPRCAGRPGPGPGRRQEQCDRADRPAGRPSSARRRTARRARATRRPRPTTRAPRGDRRLRRRPGPRRGRPATRHSQPAPGDPTTPPYSQGPGEATRRRRRSQPGTRAAGRPIRRSDAPQQPAPGDPDDARSADRWRSVDPAADRHRAATRPRPTTRPPATRSSLPPIEILIPVGPVRPNEGTTSVPVRPTTHRERPDHRPVPIVVIVEELPPDEPPLDPGRRSTPVVQDPPPDVPSPPADTTDPGHGSGARRRRRGPDGDRRLGRRSAAARRTAPRALPPPAAGLAAVQAVAGDRHARAQRDDPQVEAQRGVLEVPDVELDALGPRQRRAAVDLRPPGEARARLEPQALAVGVLVDLDLAASGAGRRSTSRRAGCSAGSAARRARSGAAAAPTRVIRVSPSSTASPAPICSAPRDHRAQLDDVELMAAQADPPLAVDRVAGALEPDRERRRAPSAAPRGSWRGRERDVQQALAPRVEVPRGRVIGAQKTITARPRRPPASMSRVRVGGLLGRVLGRDAQARGARRRRASRRCSSQSVRSSTVRTQTGRTSMPRSPGLSSQPRTTAIAPPSRMRRERVAAEERGVEEAVGAVGRGVAHRARRSPRRAAGRRRRRSRARAPRPRAWRRRARAGRAPSRAG